jgi:hypothetical protein
VLVINSTLPKRIDQSPTFAYAAVGLLARECDVPLHGRSALIFRLNDLQGGLQGTNFKKISMSSYQFRPSSATVAMCHGD